MTPTALRLNRYQLRSPLLLATLPDDLGTLVPSGTHWIFFFVAMSAAESCYLAALSQRDAVLAQVLHPTLNRWTQPATATLQLAGGELRGPPLSMAVLGARPLGYAPKTPANGVKLTLTLTAPSLFDAPKYYASFYG